MMFVLNARMVSGKMRTICVNLMVLVIKVLVTKMSLNAAGILDGNVLLKNKLNVLNNQENNLNVVIDQIWIVLLKKNHFVITNPLSNLSIVMTE